MIGKTLGHYEITSQLGKGGMGEVYHAKDQKLGRDVAIKVLPDEFAKDADRVARFQREAKLLASLNHPNIAAIYGLEEAGGANFLVLELVEGETLADRIKAGPIPVEEALKLALQIAEALEAAHEKGVIHRDLKPANIKVTQDGKVKVLDFGLAKAFAGEQAETNLSNSPTLSNAATQQGVILGTAAYMSPEQARGKSTDKRTDIWAFGCVLYEILTGQAAFQGEDTTEILASVVKGGANLDLLPGNIHPRAREILTRCLQKDLRKRYQDIGDVRFELEQVLADPKGVFVQSGTVGEPRTSLRTILPWVAALVLTAIIAGVAVWKLKPSEPRQVMRFDFELPEGQRFTTTAIPQADSPLAVSPDGKQIVYGTTKGLYLRSVDELTAKFIAGTEGAAMQPFFSPDGKWIGYFSLTDRRLKKIAVGGGAPVTLCDVTRLVGAWWSADNSIVYGQYPLAPIMRISADGGTPEGLIKPKSEFLFDPQILPNGKSVLYTASTNINQPRVMVQSLKSGEPKELFAGGGARYLPTGHIVYRLPNSSNIFAVPFDPDRLEVRGGPVPIVEGVREAAFSDAGTLVYIPGIGSGASQPGRTLVWVNREGKEEPLGTPPNSYHFPKVSPDGARVAVTVMGDDPDIRIWDSVRKILTRLTFDKASDVNPIWTPDGKRIVFASNRAGNGLSLYWKAADGTGAEEKLGSMPGQNLLPWSWSGDGKTLIMLETDMAGKWDIGMLSMEGDHAQKPLLQAEPNRVLNPKISPDGRYIAYDSNESKRAEIYVRPFPEIDKGKWQVSTTSGLSPLWSPDGRELFYLSEDNSVMAVAVETKPTLSFGTPKMLFRSANIASIPGEGTPWDIHPDGKRFLMIKPPVTTTTPEGGPGRINIVLNWLEELKQRVPVK